MILFENVAWPVLETGLDIPGGYSALEEVLPVLVQELFGGFRVIFSNALQLLTYCPLRFCILLLS